MSINNSGYTLFTASQLTHGSPILFKDAEIHLTSSKKVGLAGWNGCGKTTLLKIIAQNLDPDKGHCTWKRSLRISYVPQFPDQAWLDKKLYNLVNEKIKDDNSGYLTEILLYEFGFSESQFSRKLSELSGGWINRALLAMAMASSPDLLLMDEPTNHMDSETLNFFENFLKSVDCSFILISHDREILDQCTNETWFIRDHQLHQIPASYSVARDLFNEWRKSEAQQRKKFELEIERLEKSAKQLLTWGKVYGSDKLSSRAKVIENRIERLEAKCPPKRENSGQKLSLSVEALSAKSIVSIEDLTVSIEGKSLFHIDRLFIRPGERVALIGKNGVGKSVFLRSLVNLIKSQTIMKGIRYNPNIKLGYYDQTLKDFEIDMTIQDFVFENADKPLSHLVPALASAGFGYDVLNKKVVFLSGGQKARLRFLILKMNQPNFFVFDEPTNHLDIDGCEELEAEIIERNSSGIFISHDRRFIRSVATRVLEI